MREPSPRAPFDQGLFLAHFNRGKSFYDERRFEEAERELEEAYLLRPRDHKVLNLLGLVYFKQDKFEKAEEVYRKLATESPAAATLFYNLGLIYFKLNRLEEAESAFLKALELARENPKINFYLGSIYERLHRFQDAIYQYRQAGANLMVRRVEDKIAAATPSRPAAKPAAAPRGFRSRPDDTAEFKAREVREKLKKADDTLAPGKTVGPVSPSLMAPEAKATGPDTARFQLAQIAAAAAAGAHAPAAHAAKSPLEMLDFPSATAPGQPTDKTLPPPRSHAFGFLQNNLMEIDFSGKVYIKQGTIYSYGGNLTFWVKDPRPGGVPALVIITGTGKVILTDHDREITFMQVQDEPVFIEPTHLLACEESLTPRYVPIGEAGGLEVIALEGRGLVALSVASKPLTLNVTPELPVSVPSTSVITWSGPIVARVVEDRQLCELMLPPERRNGRLIRLEGTGRLLVEQTSRH